MLMCVCVGKVKIYLTDLLDTIVYFVPAKVCQDGGGVEEMAYIYSVQPLNTTVYELLSTSK